MPGRKRPGPQVAMNRRDFLLFRTEPATRVVELSCRRLALRDLEWRLTAREPADAPVADGADGEPAAAFALPSAGAALDDLDRDLDPREALRIVDVEWPLPEALRARVDQVAAAHRSRGGRVERTRA
jgi:hypothetical protein